MKVISRQSFDVPSYLIQYSEDYLTTSYIVPCRMLRQFYDQFMWNRSPDHSVIIYIFQDQCVEFVLRKYIGYTEFDELTYPIFYLLCWFVEVFDYAIANTEASAACFIITPTVKHWSCATLLMKFRHQTVVIHPEDI